MLSAVEGLVTEYPSISDHVVLIACLILVALGICQRFGTHRVAGLFGPVMVVWFAMLFISGWYRIGQNPEVLKVSLKLPTLSKGN